MGEDKDCSGRGGHPSLEWGGVFLGGTLKKGKSDLG